MIVVLLLACSPAEKDTSSDTGTPTNHDPVAIPVEGDPNGVWWSDGVLYASDDDNNRILRWTEADGVGVLGELPGVNAGLGQLVVDTSGTVIVSRFGFGTDGAVVTLAAEGTGAIVPDLDVERRRLGLALGPDGAVYDSWFEPFGNGYAGAVSLVDLSGSETDVIGGLGKPVGVWASADTLYVSDPQAGEIVSAPLADPTDISVLVELDGPDLLCGGPGSTLFTGGSGGDVRQIGADGSVTTFASGFQEVRGVAYDADDGWLAIVDHDSDDADGITNYPRLLPVD